MRWRNLTLSSLLVAVTAVAMAVALFLVFLVAPREATMGDVQRIFYFHVSASWVGYLALFATLVGSVTYLRRRERRWDILALSSTEIGLVFITEGIITGSIWAKSAWGTWWTWDPRLTTSAVLWLIYASYLILRQGMEGEDRRARLAAVYGIVAFVAVPLNFLAIRWWRTIHPLVLDRSGFHLAPTMLMILVFCVATFTLLYFTLLSYRLRLGKMSEHVQRLKFR